jgi:anti-sigma B factor antagonist
VEKIGTAPLEQCDVIWSAPSGRCVATVLELHGEIDLDVRESLRRSLVRGVERDADVLVDLADVTLLDCASLGVLVEAGHLAGRRGHQVCLVAPSPAVRRTLAVTRLDTVFPLFSDRDQAHHRLTQGPYAHA